MKRSILLAILLVAAMSTAVITIENDSAAQVPPTVSGVHILNVDENVFEIEWETSVPSKCTVEWGKTKDYGNSKELTGAFDTYFRTNVTELDKTTKYHFRITAVDLADEVGRSGDFTVITGPQDEVDGGTPGWLWGLVAMLIIILLVYFLLLRPVRQ
jgi:hypothetical protein